MQNQTRLSLQITLASLIVGSLTIFGKNGFAEQDKKDLLPLPIGNIESAFSKVNTKRNPFQKPLKSEITNIDDLYSTLQLKGLAKSGNKSLAIIESEKIQGFYGIGDVLENGFTIQSISFEDISVDISNGSKNYRLILNKLNESK